MLTAQRILFFITQLGHAATKIKSARKDAETQRIRKEIFFASLCDFASLRESFCFCMRVYDDTTTSSSLFLLVDFVPFHALRVNNCRAGDSHQRLGYDGDFGATLGRGIYAAIRRHCRVC
jgi:hypothetical protein